jgi:hypothetical protein
MAIASVFIGMVLVLVPAILATVFMCLWIYNDAKERGMDNPALWVLLGILVPNFLGLVIYLVIRSANGRRHACPECGMKVAENQGFCPRCGTQQPPLSELTQPTAPGKAKKHLRNFFISLGALALAFILFFVLAITVSVSSTDNSFGHNYQYAGYEIAPNHSAQNMLIDASGDVTVFTFGKFDGEDTAAHFTIIKEARTMHLDIQHDEGLFYLEVQGPDGNTRFEDGTHEITVEPGEYTIIAFGEEATDGDVTVTILP